MSDNWDIPLGPTPPMPDGPSPHADQYQADHPQTQVSPTQPPPIPQQWAGYSYPAPTPPPPPPFSSSPPTRHGGGRRVVLASVIVTLLVAGGFAVGLVVAEHGATSTQPIALGAKPTATTSQGPQPTTPILAGTDDEPAAAVASALGPAVVEIDVKTANSEGLGSGVVYDQSGLILTNAHVVDGSSTVQVRFSDGSTVDGQVLGADTEADIAVVKVDNKDNLTVARLASDQAQVGQMAIGIGSPFGLQETVTAGIVSAVDRPVSGENGGATTNMIQTDAPINPGNSGGALANRHGEVIGINSSIYSDKGENNGIGFAIPIQSAKSVADKIVNGQPLDHGYLGVSTKATTDGQPGAQVASVSSGDPAASAGIQTGDVITSIDGVAVKAPGDLSAQILAHSPGDTVNLEVRRNGQTTTVPVPLGTRPSQLNNSGGQSGGQQGLQDPDPSSPPTTKKGN
jgi:putative serine protease PepD